MGEVVQSYEPFSVLERFLLLNGVLPQQGDITTIRLVRRLREALSFSEEEHKTLNIRPSGPAGEGRNWDDPDRIMKSVAFGPKMRELVVEGLKAISNAGQLTDQHLDLVDRFMAEEEEGAA